MFKSARIKLTLWYLLIIVIISFSFSGIIYKFSTVEFERFESVQRFRIERDLENRGIFVRDPRKIPVQNIELINEAKNRILYTLIFINGTIIAISAVLGYFLAGRTLKPISGMMDQQSIFVSDASHELRTPLTAIKSSIEVNLRDKKFNLTQAKQLLSENLKDINKLQRLTDSLLKLIRKESPHNKQNYKLNSFLDIVNETIKKSYPLAKEREITINNTCQEITILCDKDELSELIFILLENAIKYSPNKASVRIESSNVIASDPDVTSGERGNPTGLQDTRAGLLRLRQLADPRNDISFSVIDQGVGIEEKDLPHIFDRFYRANSARTKDNTNGYGLGLSIAKSIVEKYNGSIHVESLVNVGSKFTVKLPQNT